MITTLNYTPGQTITLFQEILDGYGVRVDDGYYPSVSQVIKPDFVLDCHFPRDMKRLSAGLYYFNYCLPRGAEAVGSYLFDITYLNTDGYININSYQIVVTAPYGNFGVTNWPKRTWPPGEYRNDYNCVRDNRKEYFVNKRQDGEFVEEREYNFNNEYWQNEDEQYLIDHRSIHNDNQRGECDHKQEDCRDRNCWFHICDHREEDCRDNDCRWHCCDHRSEDCRDSNCKWHTFPHCNHDRKDCRDRNCRWHPFERDHFINDIEREAYRRSLGKK